MNSLSSKSNGASPANGANSSPAAGVSPVAKNNKYAHVKSKVGSLESHLFGQNLSHAPRGGDKKIYSTKLEFDKNAAPKVDARADHTPKGGDKKIFSQKLDFSEKAAPKVDARSDHKPKGGEVKIFSEKVEIKASSRVGSLENVSHVPGGGKVAIKTEKLTFKDKAAPKITAPRSRGSPRSVSVTSDGKGVENVEPTASVSGPAVTLTAGSSTEE
ncbi:hypothetical protein HDU67_004584 [Dinochytrium kinnereticum]|nr:hypothetical protein HDU67_004584 [Dinochytrium kinnereticum]